MNQQHTEIVQYFASCFENDNREQKIWNVFDKSNLHLYVLRGADNLLNNPKNSQPVPEEYAHAVLQTLDKYEREKLFVCAAFFCLGKLKNNSQFTVKNRSLCAPLVFYEAQPSFRDGAYYIDIDRSSYRLNTALLDAVSEDIQKRNQIKTGFLGEPFDTDSIKQFHKFSRNLGLNIDDSALNEYPTLHNESALLKKLKQRGEGPMELVPAMAFLMVDRSINTRGILHELDVIANSAEISDGLKMMLQLDENNNAAPPVVAPAVENIPGTLSRSQKQALFNAAKYSLSMIVGPPGTGKSYTIASIALDRFLQNESVLVVSNTEYAVDVLLNQLIDTFGISLESVIRGGNHDYLKLLKGFLDKILQIDLREIERFEEKNTIASTGRKIKSLQKEIESSEYRFLKRCRRAMNDGLYLNDFFQRSAIVRMLKSMRVWLKKLRTLQSTLLFQDFKSIQEKQHERALWLAQFISDVQKDGVYDVLKESRRDLVNFAKAIKARSSGKQKEYFDKFDFQSLLRVFPIWLVSLPSLHRVLPLQMELFDTVIVDEATQVNLALAIPAAWRARNMVVVGDPRQLHHVSFLSRDRQEQLSGRFSMEDHVVDTNYRDNSLIDYANAAIPNQEAIVVLDEHFRCHPDLIAFSNRWFYEGQLKVMTHNPVFAKQKPFELKSCYGQNVNSTNENEVETILSELDSILEQEARNKSSQPVSIGVLSFFRRQADLLEKQIFKRYPINVLKRFNIRVGTPYAFQGEERDVMLISCVVDAMTSAATFTYLNREDVFNVAVTRAREKQIMFLSTSIEALPDASLLQRYLSDMMQRSGNQEYAELRESLQNEVHRWLDEMGYDVYAFYKVGSVRLDLMVSNGMESIGIDLVGFPGDEFRALDLEQYKILERSGTRVFPLSFSAWTFKRDQVRQSLSKMFNQTALHEGVGLGGLLDDATNKTLKQALDKAVIQRIAVLYKKLNELDAEQAVDQLRSGLMKYAQFLNTMGLKLNKAELTYRRYKQNVGQVLLAVLDNLETVSYAEQSLVPVKAEVYSARVVLDQISSEHQDLAQDLIESSGDKQSLIEQQKQKIQSLLDKNEQALDLIDEAGMRFSALESLDQFSEVSLDEAMVELQDKLGKIEAYL